MKRALWDITLASVLTLVVYIIVFAVFNAGLRLLNPKNSLLILFLIALLTTALFGLVLLYVSKIRKSDSKDEILSDYKDKEWTSFADDFKILIKREYKTLICIVAIVIICFALNTFDQYILNTKLISLPTFLFAPMCLFDTLFNIPFVGYLLSSVLDCIAYIVFLLIYRRKRYNYWMKKQSE